MLCDVCKINQSTITIKKIMNGVHSEIHLCERCARSEELKMNGKFDLSSFVKNILDLQSGYAIPVALSAQSEKARQTRCPSCNLTYGEFIKTAKLGCENCYESFSDKLEPVIKRLHGKTVHTGKIARSAGEDILKKREITDIQQRLMKAISEENYELAAEYRDMIKLMKLEEEAKESSRE